MHGVYSIILAGATIGDNCVIGAGSVVTKNIPSNTVAVGNPVKVIITIEEFYEKRKQEYEEDAKVLAKEYYNQNGNIPSKELFRDYFPLFTCDENEIKNNGAFYRILLLGGNEKNTIENIKKQKKYNNYEDFLEQTLK